VSSGDNPDTIKERRSTKLSNKLDPELASVVEAWPELPADIRSAILAIVRASVEQRRE
jgi:hypothetical protein